MEIQRAYNHWAAQYDTDQNATRDLEAQALRATLEGISFQTCLEIGCGTGKNTEWLLTQADRVTAVDFSAEMLAVARSKINSNAVRFLEIDINKPWNFVDAKYDLVTFSLVLEHIDNLGHVFHEASSSVVAGGHLYLGELHPAKQYAGTKARFTSGDDVQIVECFTHHVTDFLHVAQAHDLDLVELNEFFDQGDRTTTPRVLTLLFEKRTKVEIHR
ncbi:MAG: class I SAM-dependent methyltransferase [Pyrinomonadaceae bacterium]